jgi:agmatinase
LSKNFAAIPSPYTELKTARIVIQSVPYDETSTWLKGADKGPDAILEASANLELYDIETDSEVYLRGIHTGKPILEKSSPEAMKDAVQQETAKYLQMGKFVVTIGGEHSVSLGTIEAHAAEFPGLTVLQLDAHADLRDSYDNSRYNHACVMARVQDLNLPLVQVGIRSMDSSEKIRIKDATTFYAKDLHNVVNWQQDVVSRLKGNVYITIDLDVFDPSLLPSTGTPEPGGLFWWSVLELLKKVVLNTNVVGFDVVELCPDKTNKAPDFLAAKLIYKILSYKFGVNNE